LSLEAANLPPRTIRARIDDGTLFAAFLAPGHAHGRGEHHPGHVEAFIAAELECTLPSSAVTPYRSLRR
jgi:hypothetical protein